ncbi:MAG: AAA domain-containing protein [Chloroflexota bacterium]
MPDDDLPIELPDPAKEPTYALSLTSATTPQPPYKISPTDISQFIRLEQCQRYLRLRLHERAHRRKFFEEYGVYTQTIPALLTRSGQSFEEKVEAEVSAHYPTRNLADEFSGRRVSDNDLVVDLVSRLSPGAMQTGFPQLRVLDPETGAVLLSAVDTVERFQGGERTAVVYSATESDRDYLLAAGKFLYDPNRLTVAISRAKEKMILVASRSVFALFSPDEDAFANAQLWKNFLRRTCTVKLWEGNFAGHNVQV